MTFINALCYGAICASAPGQRRRSHDRRPFAFTRWGEHPARLVRQHRVSRMAYTKLHETILRSTVWQEADGTRLVWITLLALADQYGEIRSTVPGLAHTARVSIAAAVEALRILSAPDQFSTSSEQEGRRIEAIDGGWRLINYAKYRHMASLDDERAKSAVRSKRYRERHKEKPSRSPSRPVTDNHATIAQAEAEADSDHESVTTTITATPSATPAKNGEFHRTEIPADWKPSAKTQAELKAALPWMMPAIASLRMVEFRAWAAEMTDPPASQAQRDRVWLKFMMRTNKGDYTEHLPRSFNL